MSKENKAMLQKIVDLRVNLIYELGACYVYNRSCERALRSFVKNLDFILYPNTVFTDENIPIREVQYEEIV